LCPVSYKVSKKLLLLYVSQVPYVFHIRLYGTSIRLGQLQERHEVPVDPKEYSRDNLKVRLVQAVNEWAKVCTHLGMNSFSETSVKF
jgi:hypothetical protein